MKRCILLIFIICHGILQISAQNSVNASGGSVSVSSGFVSFSVGQPFFVFHIIILENNIMVTQPIKKYETMVFLKKLLVLNCLITSRILFIVKVLSVIRCKGIKLMLILKGKQAKVKEIIKKQYI